MRAAYWLLFIACPLLHGVPWLVDSWLGMITSWLGMMCGMALAIGPSPFRRWWCLWIWGMLSIGIAFHWSPGAMAYTLSSDYWLGFLVAAPLIAWDGLRLSMGYWLGARLCRQPQWIWLSTACCTILLEEFMPGVFPWRLGLMQLPWPWWLQAVDVFGAGWTTLLSFTIAGVGFNAALAVMRQRNDTAMEGSSPSPRLRYSLGVACALLIVNSLYCAWTWSHWQSEMAQANKIRLGLVQVDPSYTESTQKLQNFTREIADQVDLVCWPESSAGTYDLRLEELSDVTRNFQLSGDPERGMRPWPEPKCELLLAGKNYTESLLTPVKADLTNDSSGDDEPDQLFVSAMLLDSHERIVARYHKRYLMPFGEYVPGENVIPGMSKLFDMAEHFTPGTGSSVLESRTGARLGIMLCYEDMVPQAPRTAIDQQANIIVSLINGSAFESPFTLYQHRLLSHLRSLESRRTFVRCAATGQSCLISACGELTSDLPLQQDGAMKCDVALLEGHTLYSQYPYLLLCLIAPCTVFMLLSRKSLPAAAESTSKL